MAGRAALGQRTSWLHCTQRAHCSERGVCSPQMGKPVGRIHPDGIWGLPDGTFAAWLCWVLTSQLLCCPLECPPFIRLSSVGLSYTCNPISRVTGCHPAAGRALLSAFSERGGLWWRGFAELLWQPTSVPPGPSLVPSFPISLAIHPAV